MLPFFPDAAGRSNAPGTARTSGSRGSRQPFPVGEDLDVLEAGRLHVGMAGVGNAVHLLVPETVEPAPGRRVVPGFALSPDGSRNGASLVFPTIAFPAHRAGHAVGLELVLEGLAGRLAAPAGGVQTPVLASCGTRSGSDIGHDIRRPAPLQ